MNFFPNGFVPNNEVGNMNIYNNNLLNKINEMDTRIKKLEQRIIRLENEYGNINYNEPDKSLYMI